MNPIEVRDDRAVNTDKLTLAQVSLEFQQRATQDVGMTPHMQAGVIAHRFDPVDVGDIQEEHFAPTFYNEPLHWVRLRLRVMRKLILGTI